MSNKEQSRKTIYEYINEYILNNPDLSEEEKEKFIREVSDLANKHVNLIITGPTGVGKSSTINALFGTQKAKVGVGPNPETMFIDKYEYDKLTIWDTPGLGDGKEADIKHSKAIIDLLYKKDENNELLIDLVLVLIDGQSRDLGTSYELINNVIMPNLKGDEKRILIAINRCDLAGQGKPSLRFDYVKNKPSEKLTQFLDAQVDSVKKRIKEATGVDVEPIYFSAGCKEDGEEQRPFNLSKLLYHITLHSPKEKRLVFANNMSRDREMWQDNDELKEYNKEIQRSFMETLGDAVAGAGAGYMAGAKAGAAIGGVLGPAGSAIGGMIGGIIGGIGGLVGGIFGW